MNEKGNLRIWHNSNFGNKPFMKQVSSVKEAKLLLDTIAEYDLYLGDKIQANAQGLEIYVGTDVPYETNEGWEEWESEEGDSIDNLPDNYFSHTNVLSQYDFTTLFNNWSKKMDDIYTNDEDRNDAIRWTDGSPIDWINAYNELKMFESVIIKAWIAFDSGDPLWEKELIYGE